MAGYRKRKPIKGQKVRRVTSSIDSLTYAAILVKARRDGTSVSAALSALARSGMMHEPGLMDAVKQEVMEVVKASLIETGYDLGFADMLARANAKLPAEGVTDGSI